ncbi:cobalt-precorrin-6A reductase [Rhodococcus triatomae]|uniref:Precorrin-6A/cobalt-precorrin-6A reductase n=1 Tax=Rhodococcus triatomae TaxID=300028 RepID=A0A1G8P335_9NOCA|nr:cobalt-precorrin-6A reductase [Rhodococcus triatomae]QNG18766.1 cobalt-precorrin-6A reductase [Rhodococcus triatomae]QNG25323.1 cobalt-precorrin-6A reductase [Rhodococcus triatomae]SDI86676.1 precorrin-6A/cobalt-precorrin-6A reductase [Rhodococcus triatomae]
MRVLILGGTAEARELAAALDGHRGVDVVSSLAGRVRRPRLPRGAVRTGGFGGVEGLVAWLRRNEVDAVVDATHPFASQMTVHAVAAAELAGVPLLVLRRPEWVPQHGDRWTSVPDLAGAAAAVGEADAARVFLTIGRQGVAAFADLSRHFLIRAIDPPEGPVPADSRILLARGPFGVEEEIRTLRADAIDLLVTKNSGGDLTEGKLAACRALDVPVLMIERPPLPTGVATVAGAGEAVRRLGLSPA